MFRHVVLLLLINTYGQGLGNPVPGILHNLLGDLAKNCESPLISKQITSKLVDCDVPIKQPFNPSQFQCLMFYDINKQLCTAVSTATEVRLSPDEFDTTSNGNLNPKEICKLAKKWNIADLPEFPFYKTNIPKILNDSEKCENFCTEFISDSANYFCKYYYWGYSKLHVISDKPVQEIPVKDEIKSVPQVQEPNDPKSVTIEKVVNVPEQENSKPAEPQDTIMPSELITQKDTPSELSTENKQGSNLADDPKIPSNKVTDVSDTVEPVKNDVDVTKDNTPLKIDVTEKKAAEDKLSQKNSEVEMEKPVVEEPVKMKPAPVQEPKPNVKKDNNPGNVDYPDGEDTDDGRDGFDQTLDDGDDPGADFEQKPPLRPVSVPKKINKATSFNVDDAQRDIFESDDDNFFPFFLTAVIFSVLLYVLYHNKSKVSKVVLGLIVEGRQSNRRRNSRGHSYRRLDTLEQAMSSNAAAAAPSRIIY